MAKEALSDYDLAVKARRCIACDHVNNKEFQGRVLACWHPFNVDMHGNQLQYKSIVSIKLMRSTFMLCNGQYYKPMSEESFLTLKQEIKDAVTAHGDCS